MSTPTPIASGVTSDPSGTGSTAAASPAPEVGNRAAKGFAWIFGQSMVATVVQALTQLALAWLLLKADFALVTLTYTVTVFATLLQQFGIKQVLLQRSKEMERWVTPAVWLSVALGLVMGGVTAAVGPFAASYYGHPELVGLLLVAAVSMPLSSASTVADAQLSARMMFKDLATIGVINAVLTAGLSVAMAWQGFGAYSIIAPQSIAAALRLWQLWKRAPIKPTLAMHFKMWSNLLSASSVMLASSLAMMVTYTGHFSVLGRSLKGLESGKDLLGAFSLAYSLSDQVTRVLMMNLSSVMLPALVALKDEPKRQAAGFLKAMRGLMLVGMPTAFLQAAVAGPVFKTILAPRWEPAIPIFFLFSGGMMGRLVLQPCESMLLAQMRQKTWLKIAIGYAIGFLSLTIAGSLIGRDYGPDISARLGVPFDAAIGCALGVAIAISIAGPVAMRACIHPSGGTWQDVWEDYRFPLLGSLFAALCAASAVWLLRDLPQTRVMHGVRLGAGSIVMGLVYLVLVRQFAREDAYDLLGRIKRILPGKIARLIEARAARKGHVLGEAGNAPNTNG
jgi:O-antigen/teichoic acid export membrane protein